MKQNAFYFKNVFKTLPFYIKPFFRHVIQVRKVNSGTEWNTLLQKPKETLDAEIRVLCDMAHEIRTGYLCYF